MKQLIKDLDYYINEQGYWVFTAKYLKERGFCCSSGCLHCPYQNIESKKKLKTKSVKAF